MKRVLAFLVTNALWLSAFIPAPINGQAALTPGKRGPTSQTAASVQSGLSKAAPHVTGTAAMHLLDTPRTLPTTVDSAIANNEFRNKLFNPGSGSPYNLLSPSNNGVGEIHINDGFGNILRLKEHTGWRDTWKLIVPGTFGAFEPPQPGSEPVPDGWTDLLFYDNSNGGGEFYVTNNSGDISQRGVTLSWGLGWDLIVPGNFAPFVDPPAGTAPVPDGWTDLVFYDNSGNFGILDIYATNGRGGLSNRKSRFIMSHGFDIIVPGNFGPFVTPPAGTAPVPDVWTDLFFFDKDTGAVEIWATDGNGNIKNLKTYSWGTGYKQIIPGNFGPFVTPPAGTAPIPDVWTDLVLYRNDGEGIFLAFDGNGNFNQFNSLSWGPGYDLIVPGSFGDYVSGVPDAWTDLVFYDRNGPDRIMVTDGKGNIRRLGNDHDWGPGHDMIIPIPGNLGGSAWTDLLFYRNN